ncbi:aspartate ammonia-lyase [Alicyclobacillus acidoterrestris]|uniref:aspartate ammonia-lyase n=1 Tax=Alicyclobacillus suci TaxID=2816080 RepID=UPI001194D456|nr:aspartate ammonia-lyase [Alicyclobacillus suci]GEO25600.1 aspartate ammonia-lyase [Alicyclobacillus acidoterrestris]
MSPFQHRTVHDSLGTLQIPADAYYGAQTARAIENFPISGLHLHHSFIRAQAIIKWAAAKAHKDLGALPAAKADAICAAAEEVIEGRYREWFQVDVYQAGAGTSQNMNVNEVIASRAAELLGGTRGDTSLVHPNDDVNKSQSTNDTFHIAMNIAGMEMLAHQLDPALAALEDALGAKQSEFQHVVKSGRTHLQDAVPLYLGDEFGAYAENIRRHRVWLEQSASNLLAIGMGGNAIGTGVNTPPGFADKATAYIAAYTELAFHRPSNPFTFNQNPDEIVLVSGVLRNIAQVLARIANDLRLLASGPRTGFAEIQLPAVQPGSSIMPGKINPVMAEMLNMVAFQVIGCDTTVAQASAAGQLELNVMMPVMAANFLHSIHILSSSVRTFTERCIRGIKANEARCLWYAENSLSLATAMNVELGYDRAAEVVKYALAHDTSLREAGAAIGVDADLLAKALDVERIARVANDLAHPDYAHHPSISKGAHSVETTDSATRKTAPKPQGKPFESAD